MECLDPMAPNDEELLDYALDEGPLSGAVQKHLEQCSICQQRLAPYKSMHTSLLRALYRSQCPSATTLSHYCANLLSIDQAADVAEHLSYCPLCASEIEETQRILADAEPFPA
jgi:hypothetical protein